MGKRNQVVQKVKPPKVYPREKLFALAWSQIGAGKKQTNFIWIGWTLSSPYSGRIF